jgi:hypothetical protein
MRDSVVQCGDDVVVQLLSQVAGRVHLRQDSETGGKLRRINKIHHVDENRVAKTYNALAIVNGLGISDGIGKSTLTYS